MKLPLFNLVRATQIGKITLTIGDNNQIIDTQSELLPVVGDSEYSLLPEDSKLLTHLEDWLDTEITTLPEPMLVEDQFEARMKPHPLINLINVMLLEKSGRYCKYGTLRLQQDLINVLLCVILLIIILSQYIPSFKTYWCRH